ncbi:uncharacterized protein LOC130670825 isoform X1 [Microplitis mediator]|uniref:uncharacterized protein LOC130670825 isoform X1 n=2 Tax=Microplitis mediator TaxID=375433 RepID=UPI00255547CC|nr:uncharacterized protein LOC130670825 isoform X1 [Microplitis mediator]
MVEKNPLGILRINLLLLFIILVFSITCGFTQQPKYRDRESISSQKFKRLEDFDEPTWKLILSDEKKLKLKNDTNKYTDLVIKNYTVTPRIITTNDTIKLMSSAARGSIKRKSKTRSHKKSRGKIRRLKKGRKKMKADELKGENYQEIFKSVDIKNYEDENFEQQLLKDLHERVIKSRGSIIYNQSQLNNNNNYLIKKKNFFENNDASNIGNLNGGDLSCMQGDFIPAPLVPHALIKYVKSSKPHQEYLEANYECIEGFVLSSNTTRLLCKNRQWVGAAVPSCTPKNNNHREICSRSSCDQICKQVNNKPTCFCYEGFYLEDNKCIDINECADTNGGCQYKCVNTPGSYRCECPKGMKYAQDKSRCEDVNECSENNGRGPCQDICQNLEPGYLCGCDGLPGTSLSADNHTCLNTSPCAINNAGCSHTCLSTVGRVFCLCPDGFMLQDDWKTCQDIDECAVPDLQNEVCKFGCVNTPGSYHCVEQGLVNDQPGDKVDSCPKGYHPSTRSTCVDVNECEDNNGGCSEVCENTNGSYFCACNGDERILSPDGKSCTDINEVSCSSLDVPKRGTLICSRQSSRSVWSANKALNNLPGTKCSLRCPPGYYILGEYELTCRENGNWDGIKTGQCTRCPTDIRIIEEEIFLKINKPTTSIVLTQELKPLEQRRMRLSVNLDRGLHKIIFFKNPSSPSSSSASINKQLNCTIHTNIKDGESPKIYNCPNNNNSPLIKWSKEVFADSIEITYINNESLDERSFDVDWNTTYKPIDEDTWSSNCTFTVIINED